MFEQLLVYFFVGVIASAIIGVLRYFKIMDSAEEREAKREARRQQKAHFKKWKRWKELK